MLGEGLNSEAQRAGGPPHKVNEVSGSSAFKKEKECERREGYSFIRATEDHVIIISGYRKVSV